MPTGVLVGGDPRRPATPAMDVLGLERAEKTYIPNEKLVSLLYRIQARIGYRLELYRRLHARAYTTIEERWEGGQLVKVEVPHVLTDQEICEKYPTVQTWINIHDSAVKHLNSLKGFGVTSAMRSYTQTPEGQDKHRESSAGSDAQGDKKWD